jgi:hypothetical protein
VDKPSKMDVIVCDIEGNKGYFLNGRLITVSPADRRGTFLADPGSFFAALGEALGVPTRVREIALDPDALDALGLDWKGWDWTDLETIIREGGLDEPSSPAPALATSIPVGAALVAVPDEWTMAECIRCGRPVPSLIELVHIRRWDVRPSEGLLHDDEADVRVLVRCSQCGEITAILSDLEGTLPDDEHALTMGAITLMEQVAMSGVHPTLDDLARRPVVAGMHIFSLDDLGGFFVGGNRCLRFALAADGTLFISLFDGEKAVRVGGDGSALCAIALDLESGSAIMGQATAPGAGCQPVAPGARVLSLADLEGFYVGRGVCLHFTFEDEHTVAIDLFDDEAAARVGEAGDAIRAIILNLESGDVVFEDEQERSQQL